MESGRKQAVGGDDYMAFIVKVGRRIAEERRRKGLTQQQLAKHLGVPHTRISEVERGTLKDFRFHHAAARGLNLNLAEIIPAE